MNFFSRQDETRRLSRRLVVLFVIAVVAVVAAVDMVVLIALSAMKPESQDVATAGVNTGAMVVTTLCVLGIIGLASLYKSVVLSSGGSAVARSVGGVRISADTRDPLQRRLLNVVEEMSIASGVPMPEVYLLEQESGINAFAAGHNPSNAAIAVTRGTLVMLNRAELQGVIAHEFSHILNGDMRLNIRLMGLLFGLLVIALIARTVLRFGPRGSSNSKKGGGMAAIFLAAVAVMAIGYVGLFFGRLIQAAVSRSRESLADASAVQFTRDPGGLRGALVKIGAATEGSKLGSPDVDEVAHMLFAPGMDRLFATHPPLLARLKAIDPQFNPTEFAEMSARLERSPNPASQEMATPRAPQDTTSKLDSLIATPAVAAQLVGNPGTEHVALARTIRKSLPEALVAASRQPDSARGLLLALAMETEPAARERQLAFLDTQLGGTVRDAIVPLLTAVDELRPQQRLPLLSGAFPALKQLPREERSRLISALNGMLQREGRLSLRSYTLRQLARVHLWDDLNPVPKNGRLTLDRVVNELHVLFSVLAENGHQDLAVARRAYEAGMEFLLPRNRPAFASIPNWPQLLDAALNRLDLLMPMAKEQVVEALMKTVTHDQQLSVSEAELVRVVCGSLHCPLPPLVGTV